MEPTSRVEVVGTKNVKGRITKRPNSVWLMLVPDRNTTFLVIFFIMSIYLNGDIKPFIKRGFFCDDSTIKYPFKKDTIDLKMLIFFGLVLPGLAIKFCDKILTNLLKSKTFQQKFKTSQKRRRKYSDSVNESDIVEDEEQTNFVDTRTTSIRRLLSRDTDLGASELTSSTNQHSYTDDEEDVEDVTLFTRVPLESDDEQTITRKNINHITTRSYSEFQLFFFGLCTTMLLTGIGKITIGNLRPHFYYRCMPSVDCSAPVNLNRYITDFTCTNSELKARDLSYISTSWPSGHSAVMFYSMLYLAFHLNAVIPPMVQLSSSKVKQMFHPLILYAVYVMVVGLAGFIAMSRISDYHHHVLDVISGCVIGSLIAIGLTKALPKKYLEETALSEE